MRMSPARHATKRHPIASGVSLLLTLALVVSGVSLLLTLALVSHAPRLLSPISSVSPTASPAPSLHHFEGGFGIYTAADAASAAAAGVTTAFVYDSATPATAAALDTVHMPRIEAMPWTLLLRYECFRLTRIERSWAACQNRALIPTQDDLLADLTTYLRGVQHDPRVIGYWILDDWPLFDPGTASDALTAITRLVHQMTPGLPTICGFGAQFGPDGSVIFDAATVANYVPGACDMVALYIYSASVPYPSPAISSDSFDWSMSSVLPQAERAASAQLESRAGAADWGCPGMGRSARGRSRAGGDHADRREPGRAERELLSPRRRRHCVLRLVGWQRGCHADARQQRTTRSGGEARHRGLRESVGT